MERGSLDGVLTKAVTDRSDSRCVELGSDRVDGRLDDGLDSGLWVSASPCSHVECRVWIT